MIESRNRMFLSLPVFWFACICCTCMFAQDHPVPQIFPTGYPGVENSVPNAGFVRKSKPKRPPASEVLRKSTSRQKDGLHRKVTKDDRIVYEIFHDNSLVVVERHNGGEFDVSMRWQLNEQNIRDFKSMHPAIGGRIQLLLERNADDGILIGLVSVDAHYTSLSADQLECLYPKVFQVYKRYVK